MWALKCGAPVRTLAAGQKLKQHHRSEEPCLAPKLKKRTNAQQSCTSRALRMNQRYSVLLALTTLGSLLTNGRLAAPAESAVTPFLPTSCTRTGIGKTNKEPSSRGSGAMVMGRILQEKRAAAEEAGDDCKWTRCAGSI